MCKVYAVVMKEFEEGAIKYEFKVFQLKSWLRLLFGFCGWVVGFHNTGFGCVWMFACSCEFVQVNV